MFCRKCLKENEEKRVNMTVDLENQCYVCPKCNNIIKWNQDNEDENGEK